ncbi:hypothetical protein Anas_09527 [Armadillidium nasatum]|uniref:Uncharacterized protein n=1 Tax=Armadillidium nasatum TaxID=96803 RepID=A0A5N5TC35_9CRUS|nr:hypothetical protein Anas_09527 [Armadillidium nasatum]
MYLKIHLQIHEIMEYMPAEVLELAGNAVKITRIIPCHLHPCYRNDEEFNKLVLPLMKEAFFQISRQFSFPRRSKRCKFNYLIYKRRQRVFLKDDDENSRFVTKMKE